ncbi:hypothetical protein [Actinoplanes palleronii]|uniref:Uncharacterized protein n=1 Tax=Actinoplanes palleronii TaxID=113570 RepID=A0ABQ4B9T4_9ACTN|nr:hypothetical protein [Actinoplanes palleronii]GIE67398.1 hypothetical protein Apa02nite_035060 [Actinoplanes palleronii]
MPRPVCCDAGGLLIFRNRIARDTPLGNTPARVSDLGGPHEGDPRHPLTGADGELVDGTTLLAPAAP